MVDTYIISSTGKPTILKDPQASLDYPFDWSAWLAPLSDTIQSATVAVTSTPSDLMINTTNVVGGAVVVAWISGGAPDVTYRVSCHIVTTGGREDDRSIYIKVKER